MSGGRRLACSNIAWPAELDDRAFALLVTNGFTGIELAPTRIWPDWQGMTTESARAYRTRIEDAGLVVSSLQSILFARPDLQLFGDAAPLTEHLRNCADIAVELGARSLVFGAPKNRLRGALSMEDAMSIATERIGSVAQHYADRGVCLAIEANPTDYGCDFMTDSSQSSELVRRVDSPGVRLHLDTACMWLAKEDVQAAITSNSDILSHFHISEPQLGNFESPQPCHATAAAALEGSGYTGWAAVEMRPTPDPIASLTKALRHAREVYA